jgi:hypothetical protein
MRIRYKILLSLAVVAVAAWLIVYLVAWGRGRRISKCPRCRSDRIRPSWPGALDKLLRVSSVMAYRCEACGKRFYALIPRPAARVIHELS